MTFNMSSNWGFVKQVCIVVDFWAENVMDTFNYFPWLLLREDSILLVPWWIL
jgi:hypothetical protein